MCSDPSREHNLDLCSESEYNGGMTEQTPPLDETKASSGTLSLRLPQELIDRIDARTRDVGLSRNQWAAKCFDWVLTYLPTGIAHPQRDKVASEAPREVTGSSRHPNATRGSAGFQPGWTVDPNWREHAPDADGVVAELPRKGK